MPELAELSVRQTLDGSRITLDSEQIQSGTLKRSPSKKLHHRVVSSWPSFVRVRAPSRSVPSVSELRPRSSSPGGRFRGRNELDGERYIITFTSAVLFLGHIGRC